MNRSLGNVLFAGVGVDYEGPAAQRQNNAQSSATLRTTLPSCSRMRRSVIIIPGYGLAVAQAQHALQELASILISDREDRPLRHSPGGWPDAGAHERAAG